MTRFVAMVLARSLYIPVRAPGVCMRMEHTVALHRDLIVREGACSARPGGARGVPVKRSKRLKKVKVS